MQQLYIWNYSYNARDEVEKATGPYEVIMEMIVASGKIGVKVMMELCQCILNGRGMPDRWKTSVIVRDGQFRIIYYSRIVKPNPESESESFFAISTINMTAFITSLQQQKHNQITKLL